jgi:hypothetical protein
MSIWNSESRILWMNASCYAKFPPVIQPATIYVQIDLGICFSEVILQRLVIDRGTGCIRGSGGNPTCAKAA